MLVGRLRNITNATATVAKLLSSRQQLHSANAAAFIAPQQQHHHRQALLTFSTTALRLLQSKPIARMDGIVPDVIDVEPTAVCTVEYASGVSATSGNTLTPTLVREVPSVQWPTEPDALYTLVMTDPDAPSRQEPTYREWHHWLVGNISGNDIAGGETLSAYVGSGPPQGTGLHRYVFLVYRQPSRLTFDEPRLTNTSGENRGCFAIRKFAAKYGLGNPVAGNFYQAEWDEYVPILYKQLGA